MGFVDSNASLGSTVFAYQGIIGLGWNVDTNFRVNLDGRYYGTSNPIGERLELDATTTSASCWACS